MLYTEQRWAEREENKQAKTKNKRPEPHDSLGRRQTRGTKSCASGMPRPVMDEKSRQIKREDEEK